MLASRHHSWIYLVLLALGFAVGVYAGLSYFSLTLNTLSEASGPQILGTFFAGALCAFILSWLWTRTASTCMHCGKTCTSYLRKWRDLIYSCPHCQQEWDSGITNHYENFGD